MMQSGMVEEDTQRRDSSQGKRDETLKVVNEVGCRTKVEMADNGVDHAEADMRLALLLLEQ